MIRHWVMVADAGRAQVFASDLMLAELLPIEGWVHPGSRVHARDLVAGDRGATREGPGGARSRFERHTDPHRAEAEAFARALGHTLESGRVERRYDRLVLVAPPAFLGLLREQLTPGTLRLVVAEIAHDWVELANVELARRVRQAVSAMPEAPRQAV